MSAGLMPSRPGQYLLCCAGLCTGQKSAPAPGPMTALLSTRSDWTDLREVVSQKPVTPGDLAVPATGVQIGVQVCRKPLQCKHVQHSKAPACCLTAAEVCVTLSCGGADKSYCACSYLAQALWLQMIPWRSFAPCLRKCCRSPTMTWILRPTRMSQCALPTHLPRHLRPLGRVMARRAPTRRLLRSICRAAQGSMWVAAGFR